MKQNARQSDTNMPDTQSLWVEGRKLELVRTQDANYRMTIRSQKTPHHEENFSSPNLSEAQNTAISRAMNFKPHTLSWFLDIIRSCIAHADFLILATPVSQDATDQALEWLLSAETIEIGLRFHNAGSGSMSLIQGCRACVHAAAPDMNKQTDAPS